jgi:hypothetical protein
VRALARHLSRLDEHRLDRRIRRIGARVECDGPPALLAAAVGPAAPLCFSPVAAGAALRARRRR